MRVIITGATGFIGSNLVRAFLDRGDEVWALVRQGSPRLGVLPQEAGLSLPPLALWAAMAKKPLCSFLPLVFLCYLCRQEEQD